MIGYDFDELIYSNCFYYHQMEHVFNVTLYLDPLHTANSHHNINAAINAVMGYSIELLTNWLTTGRV